MGSVHRLHPRCQQTDLLQVRDDKVKHRIPEYLHELRLVSEFIPFLDRHFVAIELFIDFMGKKPLLQKQAYLKSQVFSLGYLLFAQLIAIEFF